MQRSHLGFLVCTKACLIRDMHVSTTPIHVLPRCEHRERSSAHSSLDRIIHFLSGIKYGNRGIFNHLRKSSSCRSGLFLSSIQVKKLLQVRVLYSCFVQLKLYTISSTGVCMF